MLWHSHLTVFLINFVIFSVRSHQDVLIEGSTTIDSIFAPTGGTVELPCDVTPALPDDRMGLVIWYKQGHDTPIYTLDTREGGTSHWSDPTALGSRASFRGSSSPAVLLVTNLRSEDGGQYRCRVDFIRSPTKNTRLNLTVLIPPERLIILNQEGNEIKGGVLGPYDEGTEVNLTCVAVGGRPPARVSWWKSHKLVTSSEARAVVTFTLQRPDYGTDITCQAVTEPTITPISEKISIDLNLRPLWVKLLGGKRPLVAGQSTELVCQAVGARPKPNLSWWKEGTRLKTMKETTTSDGNVTSSILTFVPTIDDSGRVLSCRAEQPRIALSTHEDGWKLEIQHLPVVKLELGANLDADKVVEGSDVYLDCTVRANPLHSHVYFTHNGAIVLPGSGVVLANQSLVLQRISRKAMGGYVCIARNSLGEGSSDPLVLEVKYSPTCTSQHATVLRVAKGEVIDIECGVDANPMEPMTYQWWFNSTMNSKLELNSVSMNAQNNLGRYLYTVNTSSDYGWIQCTGTNSVGTQNTPCLFHILPAEKPSLMKNCEITNITYDSLTLGCSPGHDGGMRQSFLLQVYDISTGVLLRNITSEEPQFVIWGLKGSNAVGISVRALNKKGYSEPFTLTSNLLKYPQRQTANVPVRIELTTVLVSVLAVVAVMAILILVSTFVYFWKYCNNGDNNEKTNSKQDEISNITETNECKSFDSLDKNPDIIPIEGKISTNCSNNSSATDHSSVRPLLSESIDKYDPTDRHNKHNDPCRQYVQVRPLDFRVDYQHRLQMLNRGQGNQSLGPMHMPNVGPKDSRSPYVKEYENWLKYKNSLTLNTNGLLPVE